MSFTDQFPSFYIENILNMKFGDDKEEIKNYNKKK